MKIAWPTAKIHWKWLREGPSAPEALEPGAVAAWLETGPATAVKSGAHRVVYRVDLPHGSVYVKHYRCRRPVDVLRQLVRPSASRRESTRALELLRRGVAGAAPLALGEVRRGPLVADNFLVTQGIENCCPLDELLRVRMSDLSSIDRLCWRRRLLASLARFCGRLHQAGAEHNDLHLGNLLASLDQWGRPRCDGGGDIQLHLIDVPGVRFAGPLNWRRSCRNLAMLCASATTLAGTSDLRRFLATYLRTRTELCVTDRTAALSQLTQLVLVCMRGKQRSRDRRAWGNNRDYYQVRNDNGTACAVSDVPPDVVVEWLGASSQLVARWQRSPVKLGHRGAVVRGEVALRGELVETAVKRSRESAPRRWALGRLTSRAARQWHAANALLNRGIATPRPLACLEPTPGKWTAESVLITEWLPDAVDLHRRAWALASLPARQRRLAADRAAESVGRLLGRLHFWKLSHRDLKWNNVLVAHGGGGAYLTDLDGLRTPSRWRLAGPLAYRTRVRNLARLAVGRTLHPWLSHTTCWRFLRAYLAEDPELSRDDARRLARDVTKAATRYVARARRQNRPLG